MSSGEAKKNRNKTVASALMTSFGGANDMNPCPDKIQIPAN